MRTVLHTLTRPDDALARSVLEAQRQDPELKAVVVDLTVPQPDYEALLEAIFGADSIAAW